MPRLFIALEPDDATRALALEAQGVLRVAFGARERLRILEETRDGFRIADEDLRLRGPGEVLGTMQSGLPDLRFADLLGDTRLVSEARRIAEEMIAGLTPASASPPGSRWIG